MILELTIVGTGLTLGLAVSCDGGMVPLVGVAVGSTEGSIVGQDDAQDGKVLTRGDNNILGIVLEGTDDGLILGLAVVDSIDESTVDSEENADGSAVGSTVGSAVFPGIVGDTDEVGSDRPVGG